MLKAKKAKKVTFKIHRGHDITVETKKFLFIIGKIFTTPRHNFGFVYYPKANSKAVLVKF